MDSIRGLVVGLLVIIVVFFLLALIASTPRQPYTPDEAAAVRRAALRNQPIQTEGIQNPPDKEGLPPEEAAELERSRILLGLPKISTDELRKAIKQAELPVDPHIETRIQLHLVCPHCGGAIILDSGKSGGK